LGHATAIGTVSPGSTRTRSNTPNSFARQSTARSPASTRTTADCADAATADNGATATAVAFRDDRLPAFPSPDHNERSPEPTPCVARFTEPQTLATPSELTRVNHNTAMVSTATNPQRKNIHRRFMRGYLLKTKRPDKTVGTTNVPYRPKTTRPVHVWRMCRATASAPE